MNRPNPPAPVRHDTATATADEAPGARRLNLGVVAHVDAGKTSLTEALLHVGGAIERVGRVDDGTTQTDTLSLERQRGITIRSSVAAFAIDDVTVNLVDTPGHPDFIAEVDRSLAVLDGAVLVLSAVEGCRLRPSCCTGRCVASVSPWSSSSTRSTGPARLLSGSLRESGAA